MEQCDYCDETFESTTVDADQSYLTHLAEDHTQELSRIDERRVEKRWDGDLKQVKNEDDYTDLKIGISVTIMVFILGIVIAALI